MAAQIAAHPMRGLQSYPPHTGNLRVRTFRRATRGYGDAAVLPLSQPLMLIRTPA